jgi:amino acid permease
MRVQSLCLNPKVPHSCTCPRRWWHAGYHLTVSIAAPALLSLPFAFDGLSWGPGFVALIIATCVSFYAYTLISKVLEQAELEGHRFLRFRDVAGHVLGRRWGYYPVGALQIAVCLGTVVGSTLLGGESMQIIYLIYKPNGSMQLYDFIIIFGTLMLLLSQLPSFHSLRYINLASLVCCLGFCLCVVGGSIYVGTYRQDLVNLYLSI